MSIDKIKVEKFIGVLAVALGAAFGGMRIVAKKKKTDSVYDNEPEQKNPLAGKKVVFVEDENDRENADGVRGHLEVVGDSEYHPGFYYKYVKRAVDIIFSFGGLVVLSPVFLAITVAIKIDDPGPVLFTQKRIGQNKEYFKLHKFRSMKMSTPHDVPTHMLDNPDQYITRVGMFLRKHSLDELPQIWDIFVGNMSVIGPRPGLWNQDVLTAERDKYGANDVKPGLTGLAQINGRDKLEISDKAKLDGEYVKNIGPVIDAKCFLGSIGVFAHDNSIVEGGTGSKSNNGQKQVGKSAIKRRIAVVSFVAALPGEKGINRMYYLADLLSKNGFEVEFITSNFQHWEKKQRDKDYDTSQLSCKITFLQQPSYKKNIELKRIYGYWVLANNVKKHLEKNDYDLIYCSIPDNHVGAICATYAKMKKIPYVVDIEDLWPEAMKMVLNIPLITDIPYSYFSSDAKYTYMNCDAVIGSSDTYRDEPLKYGVQVPNKVTVYVGTDLSTFDDGVNEFANEIIKKEDEFWVSYAGTLGSSYDIGTLVEAADIIKKRGIDQIKIKILGDGPMRKEFEDKASSLKGNVEFLGYQQYPKMAAFLSKTDVTVNSVVHGAAQSIVSKIGDYLAAKSTMINTCEDNEFWNKVEADGFGVNVHPGDAKALADKIIYLYENPDITKNMSTIAREIGEEQFDRKKAYMKIVNLISDLIDA